MTALAPLDHGALFAEALVHLRRLAGRSWTDHNAHDPGITLLETLCYALTDLTYRVGHPVEDLFASEPDATGRSRLEGFAPEPQQALPCRPWTLLDLRKLLVDVEGVRNAWIVAHEQTLWADTITGRLERSDPGTPTSRPVSLRGLHDVVLDLEEDVTGEARRQQVRQAARARLEAHRNLCEEFVEIREVPSQEFVLCATVEVDPAVDVTDLVARSLRVVRDHLAPDVRFRSLDEMLALRDGDGRPLPIEQLFDGPLLTSGFLLDDELDRAGLRERLRLSDVIGLMMDVPGVQAVVSAELEPAAGPVSRERRWSVPVAPGHKAVLSLSGSKLVLQRRGVPVVADGAAVAARVAALDGAERAAAPVGGPFGLPAPVGRHRRPGRYQSLQQHLPEVYGVGRAGLPESASPARRAAARQLKAYLLHFDQLLADSFAQLDQARRLFDTDPQLQRTYFHQLVDSFVGFEQTYRTLDEQALFDEGVDAGDDLRVRMAERRQRFLDHLIARVGESFHELAHVSESAVAWDRGELARAKCAFLRDWPALSRDRGGAFDLSRRGPGELWDSDQVSGFERRVGALLGMRNVRRRDLSRITFDLYAEIDGNPTDEFRFRVRHHASGKILLSASTRYVTPEDAEREMATAIRLAMTPAAYQRLRTVDGRYYYNVVDESGEVVARRIEYFADEAEREQAIRDSIDELSGRFDEEGLHLVECPLLRPRTQADTLLSACCGPDEPDCPGLDPYSFRLHLVLPAYAGRFVGRSFREFAEQTLRDELPAHLMPRICWVDRQDMARLDDALRAWLEIGPRASGAARRQALTTLQEVLGSVRNVYPRGALHQVGDGDGPDPFLLGRTALGSQTDTAP